MTRDEIIKLAQKCNLIGMRPHLDGIYQESLERFAALVAAKERESCAQIGDGYDYGDRNCGDEIRARGMK